MTTNQTMFLYAAEELNFTRASEKAFVTQQCLSDHIKRLEQSLNTRLFERVPKLRLTKAGEIYYQSLIEIKRIEERTVELISDDSKNVHGRITLGIQTNRSHVLFPIIYPKYHEMYPNVTLQLIDGHTNEFLEMLEGGKIDLMLGHDTAPRENLTREILFDEPVYLLATERLLTRYLPEWNRNREWIEPEELSLLPLTCTAKRSAVMDHVNRFLTEHDVLVHYTCAVHDYITELSTCRKNETAFFCPESYLIHSSFIESQQIYQADRVMAIPINKMDSRIHVEVIYNSKLALPPYIEDFKNLLISEYRNRVQVLEGKCLL
ncbi:MAG: LysR family transcriptional regulator [Lachnospiraceae bacterium]|nr:LysR family transcriptional regulator [Lachnospiraceae bacterium]